MMDENPPSQFEEYQAQINRQFRIWMDWSTPHILGRWVAFAGMLGIYLLRVYLVNGWYIITYGLGIYLLNNLIGFLQPQIDPELDGPTLPTKDSEEFRPFSRRLPEFKFWCASARAVCISFVLTFFRIFDIPVFWPILLLYFIALFVLTMKRQIKHMIKHKYVPWSSGKKKFKGNQPGAKLSK